MENKRVTDHLANERTFLAWIRTSIALMAFGFVLVKFSLFITELSILLKKEHIVEPKGYSGIAGILMVAFGTLLTVLAYFRYKKGEKEINDNAYKSSSLLIGTMTVFIMVLSACLVAYLLGSV